MINHDFIRDVMGERKKLLPMKYVRKVNFPHYQEISVKVLQLQIEDAQDLKEDHPVEPPSGPGC